MTRGKAQSVGDAFAAVFGESEAEARLVPCMGCDAPTEISASAQLVAELCSRKLVADGEAPLEDHELIRCDPCSRKYAAARMLATNANCASMSSWGS